MEALIGADASHAWLAVYCPGLGWVDVDPTNSKLLDQPASHSRLGSGDYGDVPLVRGIIVGGGSHQLSVAVTVTPVPETKV